MRAPQQAARARQRASLASNRRRGRRIRSGQLRTHYRVSGSCSLVTGAGCDGRLTLNGPPTRAKTGERGWKARYFVGSEGTMYLCIIECGETRRLRAPIWNRDSRGIESARRCHRINFPRFRCDAWANTWRKLLPESGLAARMPCRLLSVHRDCRALEHAPKRAIRDVGGSRGMPAKRRRP